MKRDDNVKKLDLSDDFLLESAEKRYSSGDYLGALTMLNKRSEMYEPSADASALYADVYDALELYPLCADAWFRFLDTCNEADFAEGYEGLSVAFMNMGETMQADFFYRRAFDAEDGLFTSDEEPPSPPELRLIHSDDGSVGDPEILRRGINYIRVGELDKAREELAEVPPESIDFPSASGLIAMCMLLTGDTDGAAQECEKLLRYHPDNVHALTTYCAVLGAKGEREEAAKVGKRLAAVEVDSVEDLFRVSTALCETGLDGEAYEKLTLLKEKLPYSDDVLWFHAVAAYHIGKADEAIASLERLTTVYPRKAIARYYLVRMREERESGTAEIPIGYFYRLPEEEYKVIAGFFLTANAAKKADAEQLAELPELGDYFRIAFDQLDGRDEKLQSLAAKISVKCRYDSFVREILLDFTADEAIKLGMLRDLTMRNEENSFGAVICNFYREFFTHKIEIGPKKHAAFLRAFSEVYSKYALLGEENEEKLVNAAEDVYCTLEDADALDLIDEEAAVSAVIYREARMVRSERSVETVAKLFDANVRVVKEILNFII